MAVLPSADSATDEPCLAFPAAPVPTSLLPCWFHTTPLRVKTHAAPMPLLSSGPPTMAVLPSADTATEVPWSTCGPAAPLPTSFDPCCVNCASAGCETQMSAAKTRTDVTALAIPQRQFGRNAAATALRPRAVRAGCIMLMTSLLAKTRTPVRHTRTRRLQNPRRLKLTIVACRRHKGCLFIAGLRQVRLAALRQYYAEFRAPGRAAFHKRIFLVCSVRVRWWWRVAVLSEIPRTGCYRGKSRHSAIRKHRATFM